MNETKSCRPSLVDRVLWFFVDLLFATDLDGSEEGDVGGRQATESDSNNTAALNGEKNGDLGSRDGTGIVTALAAFVITQGGFVAASIKDAKSGPKLWALFTIYVVLFGLSFIGLEAVLRLKATRGGKTVRMFDRVTVLYARWVLFSGIVVLILLSLLARYNLLPGQPTRYDFEGELTTTPLFGADYAHGTSAGSSLKERTRGMMDNWIRSLAMKYSNGRILLILQQNQPFRRDYFPIVSEVVAKEGFTIGDRFAFLVGEEPPPLQVAGNFGDYYLPDYRQVPFEPSGKDGRMPSQRLRLPAPNEGERLLVFLEISAAPGQSLPIGLTPADVGCRLTVLNPVADSH